MIRPYHIPAPALRAPSPGAAYCGARGPFERHPPSVMRRWVCETVTIGRADWFCPSCLGLMLQDSTRLEDAGRRGGLARRDRLSPEQRKAAAIRAAAIRWAPHRPGSAAD